MALLFTLTLTCIIIVHESEELTMTNKQKGVLCILSSAFFFTLMNVFVRLSGDLPSIQKSFFRNFIAMLVALVLLLKDNKNFKFDKKNLPLLLIRSTAGTIGILANFYAVDHLMLSDASMLNKLSPFFAIIFSAILLREKTSVLQFVSVIIAFIGSLFIIKPTMDLTLAFPAIIGLIGGIGAGGAYTAVRALGNRGVQGKLIVFFFSTFSCIVTLPFLLFDYHSMSLIQVIFLLFAGITASGGQFSITAAYTFAPAKEISIFDYSQIIFSALLGFILFNQTPDVYSVLGYIIICGTSIFMFYYNKKESGCSPTAK